jgi:flagellar protein FlbB
MAEGYTTGGLLRRVIILVILIILLITGGIIWLNALGVIQTGGNMTALNKVLGLRSSNRQIAIDDPDLLARERLNKDLETLRTLEFELEQREAAVKSEESRLTAWENELSERETILKEKETILTEAQQRYNDREQNLTQNASYLMNMPPQQAVQILLGMSDQDMIDNLRAAERLAAQQGSASLVPVWLQMMASLPDNNNSEISNAERAAAVMRKMAMRTNLNGE